MSGENAGTLGAFPYHLTVHILHFIFFSEAFGSRFLSAAFWVSTNGWGGLANT